MSTGTGMLAQTLDEALGRRHPRDPADGVSGGPAGNARLTAWAGLSFLLVVLAQLVTLIDVGGLITWHVVFGAVLVPVALLKTATTSWRVIRYYGGDRRYRAAGPPPTPLRFLGPAVVLSTLGLLASGIVVASLGPRAGRRPFVTVAGLSLDPLTVHQVVFIVFASVTGLHLLMRLLPALCLVRRALPGVAGATRRASVLIVTLAAVAALAPVLLVVAHGWGT